MPFNYFISMNDKEGKVLVLGRMEYSVAYNLQRRLVDSRIGEEIPDTLLLLEHWPVITLGRGANNENILIPESQLKRKGIAIYRIDRGGDVTFHSPGQLIGYPIFSLQNHGKDVHHYLRQLEEVIIHTLQHWGIKGGRNSGFTGVWIGNRKIASIGVGIRRWVSYHGFSLNVKSYPGFYPPIKPCGLQSEIYTSMEKILRKEVSWEEIVQKITESFSKVFHLKWGEVKWEGVFLPGLKKEFAGRKTG